MPAGASARIEETAPTPSHPTGTAGRGGLSLADLPNGSRVRIAEGPHDGLVLLFPRTETYWAEMLPQYRLIEAESRYRPVFLLAMPQTAKFIGDCDREGLNFISLAPMARQDRGHFPRLEAWWKSRLSRWPALAPLDKLFRHDRVAHSLPVALLRMAATRRLLKKQLAVFRVLFGRLAPLAIFISGDRELAAVPPVLRAAEELGIPRVLSARSTPSIEADASTRRGDSRFFTRLRDLPPLLNLLAARKLPGQCADEAHRRILFSPGWLTLTLHGMGMLSDNPWCQGGGKSSDVFIMGPSHVETYTAAGVDPEKLRPIGDLSHDQLHRTYQDRGRTRERLVVGYDLDETKPIAVMAVPTYAEHGFAPWLDHLRKLEAFCKAIRGHGITLLWSLHPRSKRIDYQDIAERHGIVILKEPLNEVLPAADIFVCGNSTTVEWAILCGVPVFNLDYVGLNYSLWDEHDGVLQVIDLESIERFLTVYLEEPGYADDLAEAQRASAERTAMFDGRVGKRILAFLDGLKAKQGAEQS